VTAPAVIIVSNMTVSGVHTANINSATIVTLNVVE
jgi:hypothetical protein